MAVDVLEGVFLQSVQGEVAVVLIPLQDTSLFQKAGDPPPDAVQQVVELVDRRRWGVAKAKVVGVVLYADAIQKQHLEVNVQVQGRVEALDQGDRPSKGFSFG